MSKTSSVPITRLLDLEDADQDAFCRAIRSRRRVLARSDVYKEGYSSKYISFILSGWAYRYKQLADGRQQILSFLLPGDLTEASPVNGYQLDHSIGALTDLVCADISHEALATICLDRPTVQKALAGEALVASSMQREWLVSLGQRTGTERLGHLLCEFYWRLSRIGAVQTEAFALPATQEDLAKAMGLSTVHVCRKFAELRNLGLVQKSCKKVHIYDMAKLQALSSFRPDYLHCDEARVGAYNQMRGGQAEVKDHDADLFAHLNIPSCRRLRVGLEGAELAVLKGLCHSDTAHCGAGYSVPLALMKIYCQSSMNCRLASLSGYDGPIGGGNIRM